MSVALDYAEINDVKADFNSIYVQRDPREYFLTLGQLDYIIPHLAQPIFDQIIRARAETQDGPVTVLDLGCSYGVNGALMKYALRYETLRQRYTDPALQSLTSEEMLELDRNFYRGWPKQQNVRVIGLDPSAQAIRYAQSCGIVDDGLAIDLESAEMDAVTAGMLAQVDLIVSTGCVGYVTERTFEQLGRLLRDKRRGRRPAPWVASFVLRMFPYDSIARTLKQQGLATEKFEGATFVQRRFADRGEMEGTIRAVEDLGLDPRGRETEGLFHAELFVSRPQAAVDLTPLAQLVSVVSGANKPWHLATRALESAFAGREDVVVADEREPA